MSRWGKRTFAAFCIMLAGVAFAPPARAQSQDELKAARELFQEAYKDEQEKRFDQALEKFQRVAKVRASASVRYRIAAVLESLGRLREARETFRAIAATRADLEKKEQPIAESAAERAAALDKRIPKLVVRTDKDPSTDLRVTVDGTPVTASTQPQAVEVDPGEHAVRASAPGARDFDTKVKLAEGGEIAIVVPVEGAAPPPPPPDEQPRANRTLGYIALGAGGALVITGVVLLVVRANDISDLEAKCPGGVCPSAQRSTLERERDQARLFGPLGVGLAAVGVAAGAAGVYLVLRRPQPSAPSNGTPTSAPAGAIGIAPRAVAGGAILGMSGAF